jgi:hypothetical protein
LSHVTLLSHDGLTTRETLKESSLAETWTDNEPEESDENNENDPWVLSYEILSLIIETC